MPLHSMQFNARAQSLVGVPNGNNINGESRAYAVALVDPSLGTGTIAGYLGTTLQRGCSIMLGSQVEHEGIGVDPKRDRAFVSSSCDGKLRSFNLNALFVDLPPVTVTSLTPASVAAAGGASVPVQIHGTAFTSAAQVTFAGKSYASTFVNPTRINFTALAADLACGGTPAVVVSNPDPARWSATRNLTLTAPVPVLDTITPTCPACVASTCQTCTIVADGSSFMPGCSAVYVDGGRHVPTASSATELTASASVCAGATCGTTTVSVYVGTPGAANSATLTFLY